MKKVLEDLLVAVRDFRAMSAQHAAGWATSVQTNEAEARLVAQLDNAADALSAESAKKPCVHCYVCGQPQNEAVLAGRFLANVELCICDECSRAIYDNLAALGWKKIDTGMPRMDTFANAQYKMKTIMVPTDPLDPDWAEYAAMAYNKILLVYPFTMKTRMPHND
jgi:hypothetical protein